MKLIRLHSKIGLGLLFVGTNLLTSCSLLTDLWRQDEIAEYGEAVFKKQNLLTSQIMLLSDSELSAQDLQTLQTAEAQMQKECKLLNEYAQREIDAQSTDLVFRNQVKNSIQGCDASIQKIETTLNKLGIEQ